MKLWERLEIRPGVTAVIGGGGKTTLLRLLGEELAAEHRVLLCTTTKIYPYPDLPCARTAAELTALSSSHCLLCAGTPVPGTGKLTAPETPMERLAERFDYVLVEADGAAGRPLKAHAPHEPVIPALAGQTVYVVGASGFGQPIRQAAHRPEQYARLAGVQPEDTAAPETAAAVLAAEGLGTRVFVNQVETEEMQAAARTLASLVHVPVVGGSLHREEFFTC